MVASSSAAEARMIVVQMFPDSRETVENNAAPKASTSPTIATRNRTHTCDNPIRGSSNGNDDDEDNDDGELGRAEAFALNGFPQEGRRDASTRKLCPALGPKRSQSAGSALAPL